MSDIITTPHDAAIQVLRERQRELDGEIQALARRVEIATARRDELIDLIETLSRKPRPRKPRTVTEAVPATTETAPAATEEVAARPGVFAAPFSVVPAGDAVDAA